MLLALIAIMLPGKTWATIIEEPQCVYGASEDDLNYSDTLTLTEAIELADRTEGDVEVNYIRLTSSGYAEQTYCVAEGSFTLDLNGCNVTCEGDYFIILTTGCVTIVNTSEENASTITTTTESCLFDIDDGGSIEISGNTTYKANKLASIGYAGSLSIYDGTFELIDNNDDIFLDMRNESYLCIKGGTFPEVTIQCELEGTILDFQECSELPFSFIVDTYNNPWKYVNDYVSLPDGYCFYNDNNTAVEYVKTNSDETKYTIGEKPETTNTITFNANGGSGTMNDETCYGNYMLPYCQFTAPEGYLFSGWQVDEQMYRPNEVTDISGNTTIKAIWFDLASTIVINMTDSYEGRDGWNNASITIKQDGQEIATATIEDGLNENLFSCEYNPSSEYTFIWNQGDYDIECYFEIIINGITKVTTTCGDTYSDGDIIYTHKSLVVLEYTIADGTDLVYNNEENTTCDQLTYTRTLPNLEWNALYVPFEIPVATLADNYDVAYFNDVHSYDNDNDGEVDELEMEVIKILNGTLKANYPYLIRAKNEAAKSMNLEFEDVMLYAAEENTVSCSSVFMSYELKGTYQQMSAEDLDGALVISTDGSWKQLADNSMLNPFRLYLTMTTIDGSPVKAEEAVMQSIRIRMRGEGSTTGIETLPTNASDNVVHDLQGRRVVQPTKGLYIINGKKVFIK